MPSRAEISTPSGSIPGIAWERALPVVQAVLHTVALACMALLLWLLAAPTGRGTLRVAVSRSGAVDASLPMLLRSAAETVDVTLDGVPDARLRSTLRALRGSGHVVRLFASRPLPSLATAAEEEWRITGGTRIQLVSSDSALASLRDAAGLIDSVRIGPAGLQPGSGPVQGAVAIEASAARASIAPLVAGAPEVARVLVLGDATWESRFLVASLEEAGWPVDAGLTLSPRVTITQGPTLQPSRSRHALVVLLPGASATAVSRLAGFVRDGGGLVIVGASARMPALAQLRAGSPGALIAGELGAEASDTPRHGLDLVPVAALAAGSVVLETRDGVTAVAARRVGSGRVVQVGYANSWFWRMAGNDDAPIAHRRWWTSLLASVVPLSAPMSRVVTVAESDTLTAAPVAALARAVGLPERHDASVRSTRGGIRASIDPRWVLAVALLSLVASWVMRRWRGFV